MHATSRVIYYRLIILVMAKLLLSSSLILTTFFFLAYSNNNVPAAFIFGDSIFDAGNNHFNTNCSAQADFPPYGFNFFHHPTGRFTNGRTVADFIAEFLGLELQKPYLQVLTEFRNGSTQLYPSNGINFASAGSGVLPETNKNMGVTSIQIQVQQFQALIQQNGLEKTLVQNALFLLESGSIDIFNYFLPFETPKVNQHTYIQAMLAGVESFISQIYQMGARRIAIFALGPVGCVPARAVLPQAPLDKCFGKMNKMVKDFNSGLEKMVNDLPVKYPGFVAVYGAVYDIVQQLRAMPQRYRFVEVSSACCGNGPLGGTIQCGKEGYTLCPNPNRFLFWDSFHPSEHTYKLVAKALWGGRQRRIRPMNLKTLASLVPQPSSI